MTVVSAAEAGFLGSVNPSDELFLHVNGQRWPCRAGDILGRQGTVAIEVLRPVDVLSRRHLSIQSIDGVWCLVALPESRNDTWIDGVPMRRGQPYPLTPMQLLQVDSFQFHLGAGELPGAGAGRPAVIGFQPGGGTLLYPSTASLYPTLTVKGDDDTRDALPLGNGLDSLPGAAVETDVRLNIHAANRQALALLGSDAAGRDLDEWTPERTRLRSHLLTLDQGVTCQSIDVRFHVPAGSRMIEISATRLEAGFMVFLRDVSAEHQVEAGQQSLFQRLFRQSGALSELSLSRAFQEGDVPKSLTLLAHRAAEGLECRRVSAWLKSGSGNSVGEKVVRQVVHDTSGPVAAGTMTDLAYCPMFFDNLRGDEPWAEAVTDTPMMSLLREIGFAGPETGSLLCVGLRHSDGLYGVLCFERTGPERAWSREDRQFAVCLASYGVLALQTSERRETMARLERSERRMTAELEEAKHYVHRILPDPVHEGPITAEWHMVPSEALGGDSFGYHWVGDLFVMYILDVVGHGTGMALLSISVLNSVRSRLFQGEAAMADPAKVLADLNAAFPMEEQNNMLFSMWYGVYNRRTGILTYSSAGHPPALLLFGAVPEDGVDYAALGTEGPSVGALADVEFLNGSIVVDPGAKLYIYTDGAFEIPVGPDREWSFEEFTAVVRGTRYMAGGEPGYLRKRIGALCALERFPDDFTIVRLSFSAPDV
ncbi:MAG: response regulator receiver modulated serine phosphatase [Verrucomicrobiales bacterium]|nr:response regulator receiver modulated serine phosphatase [Verrucomicrobiales bacterium]